MNDTVNNKHQKIRIIRDILRDVRTRQVRHYNKFTYYKKIDTSLKTTVNVLNGVSISTLVLSLPGNLVTLGISIGCTSVSGLISIVNQSVNYGDKYRQHQTSYLQYVDIYRSVTNKLQKNHLSSSDCDSILDDLNNRLGLIEDNSLPIKMSITNNNNNSCSPKI